MPIRKANVKIESGKVVFSQEILDYFENIRTEENLIWIDKYFDVLSDPSNFNAEKYNIHHIRPCFTFKDEMHQIREETEKLANKFKGNLIKLSIKNHLICHFYTWKIFNNYDSKSSFQKMCGERKYINNLTEKELIEIAKLKEECAETNQTDEERKQYLIEYSKTHKEEKREYRKSRKKERYEYNKQYCENHKNEVTEYMHNYYTEHRDEILENRKKYIKNNKEKISKQRKEYTKKNKQKKSEYDKIRRNRQCYDPIKEKPCTYGQLSHRKSAHKELYKNVILNDCIIKIDNIP